MATTAPPSDWQGGKTLIESFDHLLTSGIASDVTFIVGEERNRISAHRLVLLSRSPVFYAMLEGPMAEKGEITIPDISSETFKLFLRYLYTDTIDLTDRNVVPVLNVARKYCVDILVSLCGEFFAKNLTVDSACVLFEQSHVFVMESLRQQCLQFILNNAPGVLRSATFTDLCLNCMTCISGSDDLKVVENGVYEAIIRWSEAECGRQNIKATAGNRRDVLGETLYNVRFLHLEEDFLLRRICSDMVLRSDDLVDIINHKKNNKPLLSEKLNAKRRSSFPWRISRIGIVKHGQWTLMPTDEGISFKSSVDLYMFGFGSFFTKVERSSVDLKVFEDDVCLVQGTKLRGKQEPDTPYMGDIILDNPIKIHAGKTYTVIERSHHTILHFFEKGITKVTHQDITIEFMNSSKSRSTTTDRGHIPYLILSY
ncbi:BTB/POZ domain-containing protein 6-like [Pecten maximus]|uniref:BTB/POZ domain-containing protein 6-like n=1 Tax=Pecten maximus TaxID=6579 RepID=UPI001458E225|nr:BTB/POZ domain-containing protein 6-like [Pecten maximus]